MAGPCACHSFCQNSLLTGKDELAGTAQTQGNGSPTPTSVVSRAPNSAPATVFVGTLSLDNKLFKQLMKAYLEAQVPGQTKVDLEPCKQPLKA